MISFREYHKLLVENETDDALNRHYANATKDQLKKDIELLKDAIKRCEESLSTSGDDRANYELISKKKKKYESKLSNTSKKLEELNKENPETDEPETDNTATDEPATDEPATDEPATDEPATDEPATDEPATNNAATNNAATNNTETNNAATNNAATNNAATNNAATNNAATNNAETNNTETDDTETDDTEELSWTNIAKFFHKFDESDTKNKIFSNSYHHITFKFESDGKNSVENIHDKIKNNLNVEGFIESYKKRQNLKDLDYKILNVGSLIFIILVAIASNKITDKNVSINNVTYTIQKNGQFASFTSSSGGNNTGFAGAVNACKKTYIASTGIYINPNFINKFDNNYTTNTLNKFSIIKIANALSEVIHNDKLDEIIIDKSDTSNDKKVNGKIYTKNEKGEWIEKENNKIVKDLEILKKLNGDQGQDQDDQGQGQDQDDQDQGQEITQSTNSKPGLSDSALAGRASASDPNDTRSLTIDSDDKAIQTAIDGTFGTKDPQTPGSFFIKAIEKAKNARDKIAKDADADDEYINKAVDRKKYLQSSVVSENVILKELQNNPLLKEELEILQEKLFGPKGERSESRWKKNLGDEEKPGDLEAFRQEKRSEAQAALDEIKNRYVGNSTRADVVNKVQRIANEYSSGLIKKINTIIRKGSYGPITALIRDIKVANADRIAKKNENYAATGVGKKREVEENIITKQLDKLNKNPKLIKREDINYFKNIFSLWAMMSNSKIDLNNFYTLDHPSKNLIRYLGPMEKNVIDRIVDFGKKYIYSGINENLFKHVGTLLRNGNYYRLVDEEQGAKLFSMLESEIKNNQQNGTDSSSGESDFEKERAAKDNNKLFNSLKMRIESANSEEKLKKLENELSSSASLSNNQKRELEKNLANKKIEAASTNEKLEELRKEFNSNNLLSNNQKKELEKTLDDKKNEIANSTDAAIKNNLIKKANTIKSSNIPKDVLNFLNEVENARFKNSKISASAKKGAIFSLLGINDPNGEVEKVANLSPKYSKFVLNKINEKFNFKIKFSGNESDSNGETTIGQKINYANDTSWLNNVAKPMFNNPLKNNNLRNVVPQTDSNGETQVVNGNGSVVTEEFIITEEGEPISKSGTEMAILKALSMNPQEAAEGKQWIINNVYKGNPLAGKIVDKFVEENSKKVPQAAKKLQEIKQANQQAVVNGTPQQVATAMQGTGADTTTAQMQAAQQGNANNQTPTGAAQPNAQQTSAPAAVAPQQQPQATVSTAAADGFPNRLYKKIIRRKIGM